MNRIFDYTIEPAATDKQAHAEFYRFWEASSPRQLMRIVARFLARLEVENGNPHVAAIGAEMDTPAPLQKCYVLCERLLQSTLVARPLAKEYDICRFRDWESLQVPAQIHLADRPDLPEGGKQYAGPSIRHQTAQAAKRPQKAKAPNTDNERRKGNILNFDYYGMTSQLACDNCVNRECRVARDSTWYHSRKCGHCIGSKLSCNCSQSPQGESPPYRRTMAEVKVLLSQFPHIAQDDPNIDDTFDKLIPGSQ